MEIRIFKVSNEKHRLEVSLDSGILQSRELETRSFLAHDFAHFALESVAGIQEGFWGLLATGKNLESAYSSGEFIVSIEIERAAALLQSSFGDKISKDFATTEILKLSSAQFSIEIIEQAYVRLRALHGQWRSTPFGGTMKLRWPDQQPT